MSAMSTIGGGERKASKALVVSVTLHQAEEGNLHCPAPRGHTAMEAGSWVPAVQGQPAQLLLL